MSEAEKYRRLPDDVPVAKNIVCLVWSAEQVDALAQAGATKCLPLTQRAFAAAMRTGLIRSEDAFDLLESPIGPRELWRMANELADRALFLLERPRAQIAGLWPIFSVSALDRWHLAIWAREILHVKSIVDRWRESHSHLRPVAGVLSDNHALFDDRMKFFASTALNDAYGERYSTVDQTQFLETCPNPFAPSALEDSDRKYVTVVSTFGLPDIRSTLARISRATRGPILLVIEEEFAHAEYLSENWEKLRRHFGRIEPVFIRSTEADLAELAKFQCEEWDGRSGDVSAIALAQKVITQLWPRRIAVSRALTNLRPSRVVVSEHISDSGVLLNQYSARQNCILEVEPHSALPVAEIFRLPKSDARNVVRHVALRPRMSSRVGTLARNAKRILSKRKRLKLGIFVTTGHYAFANDIGLRALIETLRNFLNGDNHGVAFEFRMREHEDDPCVFKALLGPEPMRHCSFHRVGEKSLASFVGSVDALIEAGAPTSASLKAIALGAPVFAFSFSTKDAPLRDATPGIANLPDEGALAQVVGQLRSPLQCLKYVRDQRKSLSSYLRHSISAYEA